MTRHSTYIEMTKRLHGANMLALASLGLCALTIGSTWGDWPRFGLVFGLQTASMVLNFVYIQRWMVRFGDAGEVGRLLVNTATSVLVSHLAHWPLAQWLWLPVMALSVDPLGGKIAVWSVIVLCGASDVVALGSHVAWQYPLSFTGLAWFCYRISAVRLQTIRQMLVESDDQRAEVELAHDALELAHTELTTELHARERMELELRQAQKLEAVGRLAAGVAHEINTPVQFVNDSMHFVRDGMADLLPLVRHYRAFRVTVAETHPVQTQTLSDEEEAVDLDYLLDQLPVAATRSIDGLGRITTIVRSLKEFAHPDQQSMGVIDLNQALSCTLTIASHEYKLVADVETDLGPVPLVQCHGGEINQVILNIIVNAAHAIGDVVGKGGPRGMIRVCTSVEGDQVAIRISDTGGGIPDTIRDRIFEPFFTTKEVGRGTGQGLAIARQVIEKHHGTLTFESEVGHGTTFIIRLPAQQPVAAALAAG